MQDREEALRRLMVSYQAGDREAFEALYDELRPVLARYLLGLTRDASRAEDLVQETFLQVHRARHTYDPAFPPSPWVYAIARHTFLTDLRHRRRRMQALHEPLPEDYGDERPCHDQSLAARDSLHDALSQLSPDAREAVMLHHVEGLSFREMADRLKLPNVVLRARASRGMARLRKALTNE